MILSVQLTFSDNLSIIIDTASIRAQPSSALTRLFKYVTNEDDLFVVIDLTVQDLVYYTFGKELETIVSIPPPARNSG